MTPWLQVLIFLAGFTLTYLGVRWYWKWLDRKDDRKEDAAALREWLAKNRGFPGDER